MILQLYNSTPINKPQGNPFIDIAELLNSPAEKMLLVTKKPLAYNEAWLISADNEADAKRYAERNEWATDKEPKGIIFKHYDFRWRNRKGDVLTFDPFEEWEYFAEYTKKIRARFPLGSALDVTRQEALAKLRAFLDWASDEDFNRTFLLTHGLWFEHIHESGFDERCTLERFEVVMKDMANFGGTYFKEIRQDILARLEQEANRC